MKRALLPLAALCAAMTGCARSLVNTEVKPDGSWTRTLTFRAPKADEKGGLSITPKLGDVFALPTGALWKTTRAAKEDNDVYTAERTLQAGQTLREDLVLKGKTAPMGRLLSNE